MNSLRLVLAVIVLALGLPTVANAAESAPPGNSAVDQYRESAAPSAPGSSKVSKERRERLAREGSDGAALADALDNNGGVATGTPETPSSADPGRQAEAGSDADEAGSSSEKRQSDSSSSPGANSEGTDPSATDSKANGQSGGAREAETEKASSSAASATVGPFPVWVMIVAAFAVVGLAAIARRRASA